MSPNFADVQIEAYSDVWRFRATSGVHAAVLLHLTHVAHVGLVNYALESVRICYRGEGAQIVSTDVVRSTGTAANLSYADSTIRSSPTVSCFSVAPPVPPSGGALTLALRFDPEAAGATLDVSLVETTWIPSGAAPE